MPIEKGSKTKRTPNKDTEIEDKQRPRRNSNGNISRQRKPSNKSVSVNKGVNNSNNVKEKLHNKSPTSNNGNTRKTTPNTTEKQQVRKRVEKKTDNTANKTNIRSKASNGSNNILDESKKTLRKGKKIVKDGQDVIKDKKKQISDNSNDLIDKVIYNKTEEEILHNRQKAEQNKKDNKEVKTEIKSSKSIKSARSKQIKKRAKQQEENNENKPSIKDLRKTKKKRKTGIDIGADKLLNKLTDGGIVHQQTRFEISFNKVLATDHIKRVIQVIELPRDGVMIGEFENLRHRLLRALNPEDRAKADIIFNQYVRKNPQNLSGREAMRTEKSLYSSLETAKDYHEKLLNPSLRYSPYMLEMAKHDRMLRSSIESDIASREELEKSENNIKRIQKKLDSFNYIDKVQKRGSFVIDLYMFIEIVSEKDEITMDLTKHLKQDLTAKGYILRDIEKDLREYLNSFSPSSLQVPIEDKRPFKKNTFNIIPFLSTSNIPSCDINYSTGIVRCNKCEIYFGNSLENKYRFDISVSDSITVENYLVIGSSGSGKTTMLQTAMLTWLDNTYANLIVKEFRGGEWTNFAKIFGDKASVVNMDINNAVYINTYIIPDKDLYGFTKAETTYNLSYTISQKVLTTLSNPKETDLSLTEQICGAIVKQVFLNNGVVNDLVSTYVKSKKINFRESTWLAVLDVCNNVDYIDTYGILLTVVKNSLASYFAPKGTRRSIFENELSLEDLLFNNKIIIFDYNTSDGTFETGTSSNELGSKMLQESFIETLYCAMKKKKDEYTIVISEEIADQLKNPLLADELNKLWSNSKSLNIINMATTNQMMYLYETDQPEIKELMAKTPNRIIGNNDLKTMEAILKHDNVDYLNYHIRLVCEGANEYRNSFLFYHGSQHFGSVITKMPLTPKLLEMISPKMIRNKIQGSYNY